MTCCRKYLLIMELSFDAILNSKMSNENSDAGHIKCSRRPQVPHLWFKTLFKSNKKKLDILNSFQNLFSSTKCRPPAGSARGSARSPCYATGYKSFRTC